VQEPTADPALLDVAFAKVRMRGHGGRMLDAVDAAISRLETGNPKRRRVILLISEGRDHGSETPVERVMERLQRTNITVYALLYSPFLTAWTVKSGARVGDENSGDSMPALQQGGMDLIPLIVGAASAGKLATAKLLAGFTGGLALSFAKKDALERAIAKAGEDLHSQYLLTFEDTAPPDGRMHSIAVRVDSPSAIVRSRQAFWRGAQ
jgi:VWFA-related protein